MDGPKDDLKWFGEGFDGFPKRLPDDCVEYTLFVFDSKPKSQREMITRLEAIRKEAQKLTSSLLKDYIWQREPFKLELQNKKSMMYLHGITNYGDSVEDEWLIVYLLRELSSRFPDLWVRIVDTDGEFLLIEAANTLPRWLNPEIADNRVWINHSKLYIIPLNVDRQSASSLTLDDAYKVITSTPDALLNSQDIEADAFYRLRNYPSQISLSVHHAAVTIPRKLAYILHELPASIASAVEAFYLRDPIALKSLKEEPESLVLPPTDLVTVIVRFTRVLYAQVKSQQFSPPGCWKEILSSGEKGNASESSSQKRFQCLETGMKLTSGFEMLVKDNKNRDNKSVREIGILLEDLDSDSSTLPADEAISKWNSMAREDDERWLDINFEDFEKELQGKNQPKRSSNGTRKFGPEPPSGFGDAKTQYDLRKMVERFESFLSNGDAGIDGAELDDMDFDDADANGTEDISSTDSDDDEKDVFFDEVEFARMMREMTGLSSEIKAPEHNKKVFKRSEIVEDSASDEDETEGAEIQKLMQGMEAELKEAGALTLDSKSSQAASTGYSVLSEGDKDHATTRHDFDSESDDEVNIDFNLARNLLESFKSQAGMAGPGGNLLGMMGMTLPRDEDDSQPARVEIRRKN